jgi:hypothetical protein
MRPACAAAQQRVRATLEIDADRIASELAGIGFSLVTKGQVTPAAKVRALEVLGKFLGLSKEKEEPKRMTSPTEEQRSHPARER